MKKEKILTTILDEYRDIEKYLAAKNTPKKRNKHNKGLPIKYKNYISRAEKKGIDFELTLAEFNTLLALPCNYCGKPNSEGVDRIDSNKGYTKENTTPCCNKCNLMKFTHSEEDFIEHIEKIYLFKISPNN